MSSPQRPTSPFMIGPYYRPQITSMLSITHRLTGMVLGLVTAPALVWLSVALSHGHDAWQRAMGMLSTPVGCVVLAVSLWSLSFHLLNGIRHLAWDAGWGLELKTAKTTGWLVLLGSVAMSIAIWGALA